jgi:DNA-binding NarL/FixJ family response regulator
MEKDVSIILVDDHVIVRNGLESLIEVLGNYKVVGQYDNGKRFIDDIATIGQPDLVIMDLNMPELNGLETMRLLSKQKPNWKVLILTLESDDRTIIELFRLGVRGYLPKSCSAELLKTAIENTVEEGYYHSDILKTAIMSEMGMNTLKMPAVASLTERELRFLKLVCDPNEYTYDTMADLMTVSRRTIDGYRESVFEKLNVRSKTGLVLYAIKHRLVSL